MSTVPVEIFHCETAQYVEATLHVSVAPSVLVDTERKWGPFRLAAMDRLVASGYPQEHWPLHWHWDWGQKSARLNLLAFRSFGIECEGEMQGLMMVNTAEKLARLPPETGRPLVYVEFLESAPWNVEPFVSVRKFKGIGIALLRAAVQLSIDEGFHGRLGLHSLPMAAALYRSCGMQFCGHDSSHEDLAYFEMTREIANRFIA